MHSQALSESRGKCPRGQLSGPPGLRAVTGPWCCLSALETILEKKLSAHREVWSGETTRMAVWLPGQAQVCLGLHVVQGALGKEEKPIQVGKGVTKLFYAQV